MAPGVLTYAVITPARNEAANLPRLARALAEQTVAPVAWLVVDNGSTDDTAAIAASLATGRVPAQLMTVAGESVATRGGPVARAFMAGIAALAGEGDIVVKIDADVTFAADYFERLLAEFATDPALGIASGTCYELEDGEWQPRHVTGGRVRGASRAYRRDCLKDVLPLEDRPGWDGIDELRAGARGWRTTSFTHLRFLHHRVVGQRDASRRANLFQTGRTTYYTGYRPSYLILRALFKARREPMAVAMIAGYFSALLRREPRCADAGVRAYIRREQSLRRLPLRVREALGRRPQNARAV